jgi:hypothetical protein
MLSLFPCSVLCVSTLDTGRQTTFRIRQKAYRKIDKEFDQALRGEQVTHGSLTVCNVRKLYVSRQIRMTEGPVYGRHIAAGRG